VGRLITEFTEAQRTQRKAVAGDEVIDGMVN
jgi:hypothetical protein